MYFEKFLEVRLQNTPSSLHLFDSMNTTEIGSKCVQRRLSQNDGSNKCKDDEIDTQLWKERLMHLDDLFRRSECGNCAHRSWSTVSAQSV